MSEDFDEIGQVVQTEKDSFLWKISGFSLLTKEDGIEFCSPTFYLAESRWCLTIFPDGIEKIPDRIIVGLCRLDDGPPKTFHCTLGVRRADGEEEPVGRQTFKLGDGYANYVLYPFHKRTWECEEGEFLFYDTLTLTLRIREEGEAELQGPSSRVLNSRERKSNFSDVGSDQKNENESNNCRCPTAKGLEKLRSDYKKLLESGAESDLLVVVSGREFRVHKGILRVRSAVLDAMFDHESKENGKVVIDDLPPDVFRDFLEYMYTGHAEVSSDETVLGLYKAADKYDVQDLKFEAVEYMQRTLSVESFCDVMTFLLKYQENDLMDYVIHFFKKYLYDIFVTEKWKAFLKENTTAANELLVKAHAPAENK